MLFALRDVTYRRGARVILSALTVELQEGMTALVGPSGAGKSTLLRLLNRLADPDGGTIHYRGRDVRDYEVLELRREVALVPQLPAVRRRSGARAGRSRRLVRRASRTAAVRRGAATGDAGAGARARTLGAAPRRAHGGARRALPRRGRTDASRPARPPLGRHGRGHPRPGPGPPARRTRSGPRRRPDPAPPSGGVGVIAAIHLSPG